MLTAKIDGFRYVPSTNPWILPILSTHRIPDQARTKIALFELLSSLDFRAWIAQDDNRMTGMTAVPHFLRSMVNLVISPLLYIYIYI